MESDGSVESYGWNTWKWIVIRAWDACSHHEEREIKAPGERGCIRKDASRGAGQRAFQAMGATGCIRKDATFGVGWKPRGDASERTHCMEWAERRGRRDALCGARGSGPELSGRRGCIRKDASFGVGQKRRERGDASERTHHEERVRERSKRQERGDASQGAGPKRQEREDACSKMHVGHRGQSLVEEGMHTDVRI
jgi:hypothetical protein